MMFQNGLRKYKVKKPKNTQSTIQKQFRKSPTWWFLWLQHNDYIISFNTIAIAELDLSDKQCKWNAMKS